MNKKLEKRIPKKRLPISKIALYKEFSALGVQYVFTSLSILLLTLITIKNMETNTILPYDIPNEIIPLIMGINMGHGFWVYITYKKYTQIAIAQNMTHVTHAGTKKGKELESLTTESKLLTKLGKIIPNVYFFINFASLATIIYSMTQETIPDSTYASMLITFASLYAIITITYYSIYALKNKENSRDAIENNLAPFLTKTEQS